MLDTSRSIGAICAEARSRISLAEIASATVRLRRAGAEWKGCCPFHPDRTPSFTIYADDQRFMCFGCGAEGDVLDFIMRRDSVTLGEALEIARSGTPPRREPRPAPMAHSDRSSEAAAIWDASAPAARTLAERYLRGRGIRGTIPASIRFASLSLGQRGLVPALVASVSTLTGKVLGIQRTFLTPDGSAKATLPGGKSKLSLGRVKGGAIRLGAAGPELIVTEGLEDGLSLQQELGLAVWVAGGASMLPAMQLPALVRTVTIGADNDAAGGEAARLAAAAFRKSGKQVRIMRPSPPHKDFNAQLMATWNGG